MSMQLRVILADDHSLVRSGVRSLLQASGIEVVAEAGTGREALELTTAHSPDLVLLDVAMGSENGIEAARAIRRTRPETKIIMLSMHAEPQYVRESVSAGASGYVLKEAAFSDLLRAIEVVMAGGSYFSRDQQLAPDGAAGKQTGAEAAAELDRLTARERQVLQLIALGQSSGEIGRSLLISPRTVDTHRKNIMDKLEIHSIAGLTRFAVRHGVCSVDAD